MHSYVYVCMHNVCRMHNYYLQKYMLGIRHDIVFLQIFKNILNFYEAIKTFATLRSQKMISEI